MQQAESSPIDDNILTGHTAGPARNARLRHSCPLNLKPGSGSGKPELAFILPGVGSEKPKAERLEDSETHSLGSGLGPGARAARRARLTGSLPVSVETGC
jgi:hypothetical protein